MPYGNIDLNQHWLRKWFVVWRHLSITWTKVDYSMVRYCGIHLRAFSQWMLKLLILFCMMSLKTVLLKTTFASPSGQWVSSLWPSDIIWCLTAPSHYLNQCWLIISEVQVTFIIHIRAISQKMPQPSITKIWLKITYLNFHSNLPGANELRLGGLCVLTIGTVNSHTVSITLYLPERCWLQPILWCTPIAAQIWCVFKCS